MLPPRQLQAAFPCSVQAFSCYSSSKGTCWQVGGWGWNRGLGLGLCSQSQRKTWASEGLFSAHICSLQLS